MTRATTKCLIALGYSAAFGPVFWTKMNAIAAFCLVEYPSANSDSGDEFLNRDWPQDCGNKNACTRTMQPDIDQFS